MERLFSKSTLREYWEKHSDSEHYLKTWYDTAISSEWKTHSDIKQTYANASILKNNRIVFNIKGNSYRLVTKFNFEKQWIYIRVIGTHTEYDKIDAIGGKSRVSEFLNRKRKLTIEMIRNLATRLNLSPGLLIHDYQLTGL